MVNESVYVQIRERLGTVRTLIGHVTLILQCIYKLDFYRKGHLGVVTLTFFSSISSFLLMW